MSFSEQMENVAEFIQKATKLDSNVNSLMQQTAGIEKKISNLLERVSKIEMKQDMLEEIITSKCETMLHKTNGKILADISVLQTKLNHLEKKVTTPG